jgi:hypothetical protein
MLQAIDTFLGVPDCANYFIFAGYLVFMWGIVGTANYFDAVTLSRSIRQQKNIPRFFTDCSKSRIVG